MGSDSEDRAIMRMPKPENIVRITDFIAKTHKPVQCLHDRTEIDVNNRSISCRDCGKVVDAFEALMRIADRASAFQQQWETMRKDHRNLADYVPHLRAVRSLEHLWRGKRLPMCPHCKKGVGAEAMAKMGWVHQRYAEAVALETESNSRPAEVVGLKPEDEPHA